MITIAVEVGVTNEKWRQRKGRYNDTDSMTIVAEPSRALRKSARYAISLVSAREAENVVLQ